MVGVTQEGTSTRVFAGAGYLSGGKTGTAQAVTIGQNEKYNAAKLEEHQRDHSLYIAFAPADDPKIALAVMVENAGFGAAAAAPIARRVFDYWLLGQYPSEEDLAAVRKGQGGSPLGKPRLASDVAWPPQAGRRCAHRPGPRRDRSGAHARAHARAKRRRAAAVIPADSAVPVSAPAAATAGPAGTAR